MSNNLDLVQLAPNQANKETTINDQAAELDAALTDLAAIDLTGAISPLVLTEADSLRRLGLRLTGTHPGGELVVELPASRKLYVAWNTTAEAVTLRIAGGAGVTVPPGRHRLLYADGIDVLDLDSLANLTPTDRHALMGDGTAWVARALDAADVQSGQFQDERIGQSAVKQHEAALAVTESQITDLQNYAPAAHTHGHDALTGVDPDEHVAHSGVVVTAGTGLTGGGAIDAGFSLDVDVGIGDDKILQVDDPAAAGGEYLRFTAAGVEGETPAEVLAAIAFDPAGHGDALVRVTAAGDGLEAGHVRDQTTGVSPEHVFTDTGLAINRTSNVEALHVEPPGAANDLQGIRLTSFRPHLTLEDKSSGARDFQLWVDGDALDILHGELGLDPDKLPTRIARFESSGNWEIGLAGGRWSLGQGNLHFLAGENVVKLNRDLELENNVLAFNDGGDITGSNVDHLWHDDATNAWHFVSDSTKKAEGNGTLVAGGQRLRANTVNLDLLELDGSSTHNRRRLALDNDSLNLQTRTDADAFVANDYILASGAGGATQHEWRVENASPMILAAGGLAFGTAADVVVDHDREVFLRSWTVATAPSAAAKGAGAEIFVANGAGSEPVPAFSDGTGWRRGDDRSPIAA